MNFKIITREEAISWMVLHPGKVVNLYHKHFLGKENYVSRNCMKYDSGVFYFGLGEFGGDIIWSKYERKINHFEFVIAEELNMPTVPRELNEDIKKAINSAVSGTWLMPLKEGFPPEHILNQIEKYFISLLENVPTESFFKKEEK